MNSRSFLKEKIKKHLPALVRFYYRFRISDRILFLEWHIFHSWRLRKFKNIHAGKSCFIIGNGPSLNKMDLAPLKNYYTFGLNKIYLMFDKVNLDLSYHVAVNQYVVNQSAEKIEALSCPSFISLRSRGITPSIGKSKNIYFLNTGGSNKGSFSTKLGKSIWEGHTVTYVAMQLAYFMGFRKVFLIGVDHHFTCEGESDELQKLKGEDPNHFDPNYFKGQEWQLPNLEMSELAYGIAKKEFEANGRKIFDATAEGKLAVFPKIEYAEALKMSTKKSN